VNEDDKQPEFKYSVCSTIFLSLDHSSIPQSASYRVLAIFLPALI